jgi:hypothetical protein
VAVVIVFVAGVEAGPPLLPELLACPAQPDNQAASTTDSSKKDERTTTSNCSVRAKLAAQRRGVAGRALSVAARNHDAAVRVGSPRLAPARGDRSL